MADHFEAEYAAAFDGRRGRQVDNLGELASLPGAGSDPLSPPFLDHFERSTRTRTVEDALRRSIYFLFPEASQTYVLGFFQASLLTSGAVLERVLKLEYRAARGALPPGHWTLGRCVHDLDWTGTRVDATHLQAVDGVKGPRNSRAHALLEHDDPGRAGRGGAGRGIEFRSGRHAMIEPFRDEALGAMRAVYSVLSDLYGDHEPAAASPPPG